MSKFIEISSDGTFYNINQGLGYSLVHEGQRVIGCNEAKILRTSDEKNTDKKSIYDFLLNSMVFSEHYIEDSIFYKDFIKASHSHYDSLSKKEKEEYSDSEADDKLFPSFSSYLEKSTLDVVTTVYKLPYKLDGKALGMRVIEHTWNVYEDGVLKIYPMLTKTLICFVEDNGSYVHIEPEFGKADLELPPMEAEKEEDYKGLSVPEIFRKGEERFLSKIISNGILVRHPL